MAEFPIFEQCPTCDHFHRKDYTGDCRNDNERFTLSDLEESGVPYHCIIETD